MKKQNSTEVVIGNIKMGGQNKVVVQSMTNTPTADIEATVAQVIELASAGSELVRMTVNDIPAAQAVPQIAQIVREKFPNLALVGDFHFNGNILLKKVPDCAKALDKYRINPGNADDVNFREMVEIAIKYNKAIRIGINGGSLDSKVLDNLMELNAQSQNPLPAEKVFVQAMVKSALNSAKSAEKIGLPKNKIVMSGKVSRLPQMIEVYQELRAKSDYCLHLGLTEAGGGDMGMIASSAALSILLNQNIGDTIRISLTPEPGIPRKKEVEVGQMILQSLELQNFKPRITACPGCGRTTSTFFQELAKKVSTKIDQEVDRWKKIHPGVEDLKIAVMGCIVNGPGESKSADIGISLPGHMEKPIAPIYIDGKLAYTLKGDNIDEIEKQFFEILDHYIQNRFK